MLRIPRLLLTTTALPAALFYGVGSGSALGAVTQRWSFNNAAGAAGDTTEVPNQVTGGEAAVIRGTGATFTGTSVNLPGGGSGTAAYVDLPNNIVSPLTTATIEGWVTINATGNAWARFFDFGTNTTGEITGVGGGFTGTNYFFLCAAPDGNYNGQQLEYRINPGDGAANTTPFRLDRPGIIGTQQYFAITLNNSSPGSTIVNYWRNTEHVGVDLVFPYDLNQLQDVNNWLGRSNWSADGNLNGQFDEFRIHDVAFTEDQVTASRSSGPNTLPADGDLDGMPDGWETANGLNPASAADAAGDADADGLSNLNEYKNNTNPNKKDTDDDGLNDGPEITAGTNPLNPDTDGDGLKDGVETNTGTFQSASNTGTNPLDPDSDDDDHGDGNEVASGSNPLQFSSVPAPRLSHRYSFNETSGRTVADATGKAPATILGTGYSLAGGSLNLDGGPSVSAAYAALPAGIISNNGLAKGGRGALSIEGWATVDSTAPGVWARLVDFGSNNPGGAAGAIFAPGDWNAGGTNGLDYLMITAYPETNTLRRQVEIRNDDPSVSGNAVVQAFDVPAEQLGTSVHFVLTYDESSGRMYYYENGNQVAQALAEPGKQLKLSDLNDVNNWLGRSNFNGDANLDGSYQEFRIYDNVLSADEVAAHFTAGPDAAPGQAAEPDADSDGMPDWFERTYGLNPASQADAALDPDGDGLSNKDEALRGSSPLAADTDGDGLSDAAETNTGVWASATSTGTSPISFDTDGDGVGDNAETLGGSSPLDAASVPAKLVHQWHFNNAEGEAPAGSTSPDEIGGAQSAVILGDGASFTGEGVTIPGGGSGFAAYVDLPNNLISPLKQTTIELWVAVNNAGNAWSRIFDFGDTNGQEITDVGGSGAGGDYLFLAGSVGDAYTTNRVEIRNGTDVPAVQGTYWDYTVPFTDGSPELVHYVVTVDSTVTGGSRLNVWRNGQRVLMNVASPVRLQDLNDVNNWLGRSNYPSDGNLSATYQEFRIYDGVMDPATVAENFAEGPEAVTPPSGGFNITSITRISPTVLRLTWESEPQKTYVVQYSPNLAAPWLDAGAAVTATGTSTQADITVPAGTTRIFYHVLRK